MAFWPWLKKDQAEERDYSTVYNKTAIYDTVIIIWALNVRMDFELSTSALTEERLWARG